jgi:hypothetical protein
MNSNTSGWLVLTRNFVAGSHPQNDTTSSRRLGIAIAFGSEIPENLMPKLSAILF